MKFVRSISAFTLSASLVVMVLGCGKDEVKYQPRPAVTSVRANLPAPAAMSQKPQKSGDAWTVWGASYNLRSRVHREEINDKDIKITGYIIKTNLSEAPTCAVHKTGKEDPEGCEAPVPTFWLADSMDDKEQDSIRVMGWASNFAQLYDAVLEYKKLERSKKEELEEPLLDAFWGVKLPFPLPNVGAKVTVKGNYSNNFTRATRGAEADPIMGILTYDEVEYLEKPAEPATLPGMK
jgi:hypothetical protein